MTHEINGLVRGKSKIVTMTTQFVCVPTLDHAVGAWTRVPSSSSGPTVACPWHNQTNRSAGHVRAL